MSRCAASSSLSSSALICALARSFLDDESSAVHMTSLSGNLVSASRFDSRLFCVFLLHFLH